MKSSRYTDNEFNIVERTIEKVGKKIVIGTPLALGKANHILNAFYKKALEDPEVDLKIITALSLAKPKGKSLLEKRFIEPFADRVFGDYEELLYEANRENLPENVQVIEFYFPAGKQLHNKTSQQNYISTNYTHVARDLIDAGVNVLCQIVAPASDSGTNLSLSCNPDVAMDVYDYLKKNDPESFVYIAQINKNLPFMFGDAIVPEETFDYIFEREDIHFKLFGPPKMAVTLADHLIGIYASTLVKDGGELQIGIGSLGDALVNGLLLRQKDNPAYLEVIKALDIPNRYQELIERKGDTGLFQQGLFAASEMFVDGFMDLIEANILKRKVYDHIGIQRLINEGLIDEEVTSELLYELVERRYIKPKLSKENFETLVHFGILKASLKFENGSIIFSDGTRLDADLNQDQTHQKILSDGLGDRLKNGAIMHGGFFLGCQKFYQWLRDLPLEKRREIHMKSVQKINQLYGHEELDRLHRKDARFINTCMMMTLFGAAVSDGLEDGRIVSGVGGQFNFVAMAQELPDGYSILQLRSTRLEAGRVKSNIVFNYGHVTIPRHMRDIVITEYGIADVRGKTDQEVAIELIQIADSRFQEELISQAKDSGKLHGNFELHEKYKNNLPAMLETKLVSFAQHFEKFPFGTDLTPEEIKVGGVLKRLKKMSKTHLVRSILASLFIPVKSQNEVYLERMGLWKTKGLKEKLFQKLINANL